MTRKTTKKVKKCPYCQSSHTIKKGVRRNTKKPITRYLCKQCGRKFQEKRLLRNHNGCSKGLKLKMIDEYFENHKNKRKKRV